MGMCLSYTALNIQALRSPCRRRRRRTPGTTREWRTCGHRRRTESTSSRLLGGRRIRRPRTQWRSSLTRRQSESWGDHEGIVEYSSDRQTILAFQARVRCCLPCYSRHFWEEHRGTACPPRGAELRRRPTPARDLDSGSCTSSFERWFFPSASSGW